VSYRGTLYLFTLYVNVIKHRRKGLSTAEVDSRPHLFSRKVQVPGTYVPGNWGRILSTSAVDRPLFEESSVSGDVPKS